MAGKGALLRSKPRGLGRSYGGFVLRTKFNLRLRRGWGLSGFEEGAVEAALAYDGAEGAWFQFLV